jgi:hypothetical protein
LVSIETDYTLFLVSIETHWTLSLVSLETDWILSIVSMERGWALVSMERGCTVSMETGWTLFMKIQAGWKVFTSNKYICLLLGLLDSVAMSYRTTCIERENPKIYPKFEFKLLILLIS